MSSFVHRLGEEGASFEAQHLHALLVALPRPFVLEAALQLAGRGSRASVVGLLRFLRALPSEDIWAVFDAVLSGRKTSTLIAPEAVETLLHHAPSAGAWPGSRA